MEIVTFVEAPRIWKRKECVARVNQRALLGNGRAVPRGLRGCYVEAAASGESQFEAGERLIASVAQPIIRIDADPGIGLWQKLDTDFLILDGVARPKGGGAGRNPKANGREKQGKKQAEMGPWQQSDSIVTRVVGRSKIDELIGRR